MPAIRSSLTSQWRASCAGKFTKTRNPGSNPATALQRCSRLSFRQLKWFFASGDCPCRRGPRSRIPRFGTSAQSRNIRYKLPSERLDKPQPDLHLSSLWNREQPSALKSQLLTYDISCLRQSKLSSRLPYHLAQELASGTLAGCQCEEAPPWDRIDTIRLVHRPNRRVFRGRIPSRRGSSFLVGSSMPFEPWNAVSHSQAGVEVGDYACTGRRQPQAPTTRQVS